MPADSGLQIETKAMAHNELFVVRNDNREHVIVVQRGRVFVETADRCKEVVGGRDDVFDGRASAVVVPPGETARLVATGITHLAVVSAPAQRTEGAVVTVVRPDGIAVEFRGTGYWAREVHDIVIPGSESRSTYQLSVGETFSRGGIWSSYPPHRHAHSDSVSETKHAEVFHLRVQPADGFAIFLDYPDDIGVEHARVLHDGDIVSEVRGFHSFACAAGYELYYLWALWGEEPKPRFRTDTRHAWIENAL